MHPCLQIDDIVRIIAAHVDDGSSRPNNLRGLYNMALTCRTFCEPALEEQWRCLQHIDILVKCLPEELLECVSHSRYHREEITIKQVPLPYQWERIHYYARFVHEFTMSDYSGIQSTQPTDNLVFFAEHYPKSHLFPRLERLVSLHTVEFKQMGKFAQLVIPQGHSLRRVQIGGETSYHDIEVLLGCIRTRSPRLTELHIAIPCPPDAAKQTFIPMISRFICYLDHLTQLTLHIPFNSEAMDHIARLPCLASLAIYIYQGDFPPFPNSRSSQNCSSFNALRHLNVQNLRGRDSLDPGEYSSHTVLTAWLQNAGTLPRLLSCVVKDYTLTLPDQFHTLITLLSRFSTITRLEMTLGDVTTSEGALIPLLDNLPHVQRFVLDLSDEDIILTSSFPLRMASAWPDLVYLTIWPSRSPQLNASHLLSFAAFCPRLEYLEFPVCLEPELPENPISKLDESIQRKLEHYDPSKSSVKSLSFWDDPEQFPGSTKFLTKYFPVAELDQCFVNEGFMLYD